MDRAMRKYCRRYLRATLFVCVSVLTFDNAFAGDNVKSQGEHQHHPAEVSRDPSAAYTRSEAFYKLPDVTMVTQEGDKVDFSKELDDGRPVMLNFIFTTCAAICPLLSHVFASTQTKLGKEADKVHLVSVSIDPEQDTPARLSEYAKKFKAGKGWQFYTGTTKASIDLQKAFNTFRGDKMNHLQLIFYRVTPGKPWVRLEGFASADDLIREFHNDSKEASAKDK
ncbi:MAG: SCO family protein [Methylococcales bacterium]